MRTQKLTTTLSFAGAIALGLGFLSGCSGPEGTGEIIPMHPFADGKTRPSGRNIEDLPPPIQISGIGGTARGTATPTTIDTRTFDPQVIDRGPWRGETKQCKAVKHRLVVGILGAGTRIECH